MFGLLNVNKPHDVTSRDVVNDVQRLVRPSKVGHAGTLDPMATGLLVVCVGKATRIAQFIDGVDLTLRCRQERDFPPCADLFDFGLELECQRREPRRRRESVDAFFVAVQFELGDFLSGAHTFEVGRGDR